MWAPLSMRRQQNHVPLSECFSLPTARGSRQRHESSRQRHCRLLSTRQSAKKTSQRIRRQRNLCRLPRGKQSAKALPCRRGIRQRKVRRREMTLRVSFADCQRWQSAKRFFYFLVQKFFADCPRWQSAKLPAFLFFYCRNYFTVQIKDFSFFRSHGQNQIVTIVDA